MKITIIFGLSLLTFSCTSLKKSERVNNQIFLTKDNISKIDGEYEIFANDTSNVSLDLALTLKKYWWNDFDRKKDYLLQIKSIDSSHLLANIFRSDTLVGSKIIKFKIQEGKLVINKTKISPFYFILNGFANMKTRITLLNSDNLLIDHDDLRFATLIIIPIDGDRANCEKLEFNRKLTNQ